MDLAFVSTIRREVENLKGWFAVESQKNKEKQKLEIKIDLCQDLISLMKSGEAVLTTYLQNYQQQMEKLDK